MPLGMLYVGGTIGRVKNRQGIARKEYSYTTYVNKENNILDNRVAEVVCKSINSPFLLKI